MPLGNLQYGFDWAREFSSRLQGTPFDLVKRRPREELIEIIRNAMFVLRPTSWAFCFVSQTESEAVKDFHVIEARIKRLVEEGNVSEARSEVSRVPFGSSELLNKWKLLLAEPTGKPEEVASGGRLRPNLVWLQGNSMRYKGQWVALKDGRLLGNNPSRLALRSSLKEAGGLKGAMFFRVEE
jgi:hypothetical protein